MEKERSNKLSLLLNSYLWFLDKTVKFEIKNREVYTANKIIGYWHEDSYPMNLVLKELAKKDSQIEVIVTADKRGNYIEDMIKKCGGNTIRLPDGFGTKPFLKSLIKEAKKEGTTIATALDGPLGPRHVPKTLIFFLSETGEKEFISICFSYSKCLRIKKRWDQYVIPLPFTKITAFFHLHGVVNKKQTKELTIVLQNLFEKDGKEEKICYNGGR